MKAYETSATVEDHGRVHVSGVPFAPGTQVEVMIRPVENGAAAPDSEAAGRAARLLAALDKARNGDPIGTFRRAELYDRSVLR
jgi:hypothetical protein